MTAKDRLESIENRIALACQRAGRKREEITLVAVSKMMPASAIQELYDLGVRDFGESRLQEAQPKIASLPSDIHWHFIGRLQSNKAKAVAGQFEWIHTIENESQLKEIAKQNCRPKVFLEVNIANESQKSGISPSNLDVFQNLVLQCTYVHFCGLMMIGPADAGPEGMRPYFKQLAEQNQLLGGSSLSMGMSGDFEVAIEEGATHIRVGSALFGSRY